MLTKSLYLKILLLSLAVGEELVEESANQAPAVEILMHLPREFDNVNSFISYFRNGRKQTLPERRRRKRESEPAKVQTEEDGAVESKEGGTKSQANGDEDTRLGLREDRVPDPMAAPLMDIPGGIARSLFMPGYDADGRREETRPVNDDEDRVQRDKRTFMDGNGGGERETTTALPYWKRKKESPPFVTGRDSGGQKIGTYQPAQHRSIENARESHSMKDLDKSVISNEITRNNQDNYFASTNRRTYNSRQAENYTPRTPKSVYDTIDYSNRKRNQDGRSGFGRNFDSKRQTIEGAPAIAAPQSEPFARQYTYPRPYDRPYYPFPSGEAIGRGVEYYHRTFDPASGRIVYYANMPDPSRYYDPGSGFGDPTGRSIYVNGRTYLYDPYGRSYIYPNIGYGRPVDYLRNGRSSSSSSEFYDKGQRGSRFNSLGDTRSKDDYRNRTYIIFDAEENAPDRRGQPFPPPDYNRYDRSRLFEQVLPDANELSRRFAYPFPPYGPPFGPPVLPAPPPAPIYPPNYYRNQYYPTAQPPLPPWSSPTPSQKPYPVGTTPSNYVTRPLNVPEVQLPLSTRNRGLYGDYDRMKKT